MANINLSLVSTAPLSLGPSRGKAALRKLVNRLMGILSGAAGKSASWSLSNSEASTVAHRAAGLWLSGSTGTVSCLVNGTQVDVTYATSTTVTAGLMVTAINADATASTFVSANQYVGKLTLATAVTGNQVQIGPVVFTALVAGATATAPDQFVLGGSDTASALSLANAINAHPELGNRVTAVNSAGVVYVALLENRAPRSDEVLRTLASTITVNNQIVAGGLLVVVAHSPGLIGNACTLTASGTGASVVSLVSGKLGGGLGVTSAPTLSSSK